MPFIGVLCRGSSERELKAAGAVAIYKSGRFAGELGSLRFDAGWGTSGEAPSYVTSRAELRRQAVLSERTDSLQSSAKEPKVILASLALAPVLAYPAMRLNREQTCR